MYKIPKPLVNWKPYQLTYSSFNILNGVCISDKIIIKVTLCVNRCSINYPTIHTHLLLAVVNTDWIILVCQVIPVTWYIKISKCTHTEINMISIYTLWESSGFCDYKHVHVILTPCSHTVRLKFGFEFQTSHYIWY